MKNIFLLISVLISIYFIIPLNSYSQCHEESKFYVGLGTSLSSYIGSDFGKTFAIRYWNNYDYYDDDYYYNNYNYGRHSHYNDYNPGFLSPLQLDFVMGVNTSNNLSFQIESSVIWHANGRIDPQYETGSSGISTNYIDRYDNSTLLAIPIFATVKVYPFGRKMVSFYLSGSYGIQYTKESVDRVREVYDYNYGGYYGSPSSYDYTLANYWDARWIHGFKTAMGVSFNLYRNFSSDVELRITNFFPSERINNSPLTMFRSPNLTNIALSTNFYFGL